MNNEKLNTADWKTFPERIRIYHESSVNSFDWGDANCAGDSDEVAYTRDDTIQSKAQVAREFMSEILRDMTEQHRATGLTDKTTLKELVETIFKVEKQWNNEEKDA